MFFVITALVASMGFIAPPRKSHADGLDSDGRLTP
jgi:hypothetical protein